MGGFTYTTFKPPQRIELKDSGPSGHGRRKLYFICNCLLPHLPKGLTWLYPVATSFLLPMRQIPSPLNNIRHGHMTRLLANGTKVGAVYVTS